MASLFLTPAQEVADTVYQRTTSPSAFQDFAAGANMEAMMGQPGNIQQPMGIAPPPGSAFTPMVPPSGMPGVPSFGEMPAGGAPQSAFTPPPGAPAPGGQSMPPSAFGAPPGPAAPPSLGAPVGGMPGGAAPAPAGQPQSPTSAFGQPQTPPM